MGRKHGPEFVQRIDPDLRWSDGQRCTHRGVAHPRRHLAREAGADLKIQDLPAASTRPLIEPQPLTVQGVPAVCDYDRVRSVC